MPIDRAGVVLCGGRSSRMGRAKAWLPWFGRTMIEHVVDRLRPVVDEVVVVSSAELDLPPLDVRVVRDREPGLGPLAAIRCGLEAASARLAFVTSVDAPYLEPGPIEAMFDVGCAAAPIAGGRVQVLSAVYPCAAWREAERLLAQGVRRPLRLLESLDFKPVDELAWFGMAPWEGFNTPDEYLDAIRALEPGAKAYVELLGRAAARAAEARYEVPVGTLGDVLSRLPDTLALVEDGRIAKAHLVGLGGRDLVRDLAVPVGPEERVSVIDSLVGG